MVIKVYQSQVRADTRPTVANAPNINTGATEFYSSLAGTINQTGKELGDFFIKKKQNEIELEVQVNNGSLNEELTDLYNSYLDPQGDMYLTPEKWVEGNDSFQTQAQTLINNKYNTIENKIVADTVKAKFSENFLTLEKDLTKKSFERTSNLLESSLSLNVENLISGISNSNDGFELAKLTDELANTVAKQIGAGFYKEGETYDSLIQTYFTSIATNRIIAKTDKMNLTQVKSAFKKREFGDEITNEFLASLTKEDYEKLTLNALDNAKEKFDKIIKFEESANNFFQLKHQEALANIITEKDPVKKLAIKNDLMQYAAGDFALEQIVAEAFENNNNTVDIGDLSSLRMKILLNEIDQNQLIAEKSKYTETTFNTIQDLWSRHNAPQSTAANQIRKEIQTMFFFNEDKTTNRDDPLAEMFDTQADLTLVKFNRLIRDPDISLEEARIKVMTETKKIVQDQVYDIFAKDLARSNRFYVLNNITITPETYNQTNEYLLRTLKDKQLNRFIKEKSKLDLLYQGRGVIGNEPRITAPGL